MRKTQVWMMTVILISGILAGCSKKKETVVVPEEQVEVVVDTLNTLPEYKFIGRKNYVYGIYKYLLDSINPKYTKGELTIPLINVVKADATNSNDIKVWGDYWVFNYKLKGDTLKTISGGNHPGLMHVKQVGETFRVTKFDQVADGSDNTPSAKKIFGNLYTSFRQINSDEKERQRKRTEAIRFYVRQNKLSIKSYQDEGWEPIDLF